MQAEARLKANDRKFFNLVTEAVLSNPFLDERVEILKKILPGFKRDLKNGDYRLMSIMPGLSERISRLERKGLGNLQHFKEEEDRLLLKRAFLLQLYLSFIQEFDNLIQNQLSFGQTPAEVPFAKKILSNLSSRGLSEKEGLHYLALFFQLRRAFYFIDHALVGDCPSMRKLRLALWNNIFTFDVNIYDQHLWNRMEDFSTILEGETGTGKGSAAAAIGKSGFIPFDPKKKKFTHNFNETFMTLISRITRRV